MKPRSKRLSSKGQASAGVIATSGREAPVDDEIDDESGTKRPPYAALEASTGRSVAQPPAGVAEILGRPGSVGSKRVYGSARSPNRNIATCSCPALFRGSRGPPSGSQDEWFQHLRDVVEGRQPDT
jgi:hypothetical protein